ncbi:MAG: 6-phosphogluconolactonase [Candidatus Azobacteroides sp.]|nr:6-phosphogluconolactonase [Candidatus Azobacteroides sp.]
MTDYRLHIGKDKYTTAGLLAQFMEEKIQEKNDLSSFFHLAISGGNTPNTLFSLLAEEYKEKLPWKEMKFFWVDERCVPPEDPESNAGTAEHFLLSKVPVPRKNIFRMKGENIPGQEVIRYSSVIQKEIPFANDYPVFDMILLGMGNDGHTASIFPNKMELLDINEIVSLSEHPLTKQQRITLTGKTLCNAQEIVFFVTGKEKAKIIKNIVETTPESMLYPASHIHSVKKDTHLFLDEEAASELRDIQIL